MSVWEGIMFNLTNRIIYDLTEERKRQNNMHNYFEQSDRMAILTEEVGEVAKALLDGDGLREELIQVAAVAIRWVEELDAGN
jgi:NTP pyrophosphatase (non-canonical NTP hydrolase)